MAKKKKKRAPGGGRKPQGEFSGLTETLSIKIPKDMRAMLDRAVLEYELEHKRPRSLTQEVLSRLNATFGMQRNDDPQIRAIGYLIGQLALWIGPDWYTNHWYLKAFRAGVEDILESIQLAQRKEGLELERPEVVDQRMDHAFEGTGITEEELEKLKTPSGYARVLARQIMDILRRTPPSLPGEAPPSGYWPYAMPQAREALGFEYYQGRLWTNPFPLGVVRTEQVLRRAWKEDMKSLRERSEDKGGKK